MTTATPQPPAANVPSTTSNTPFALGNKALREAQYLDAIAHYLQALEGASPVIASLVIGNLKKAANAWRRMQARTTRPQVAVCGWELAHNAAGRVYTLAQLYQEFAEVEIIGSILPRFGQAIWPPLRGQSLPCHSIVVHEESQFLLQALQLVANHPYEVVHFSKPRATNLIIALLYRLIWQARVVLDIDDEELAFVGAENGISLQAYLDLHGQMPEMRDLAGMAWTQLAVGMSSAFDAITVSNEALQQRYGGSIVRHARNEKLFDPSLERRARSRKLAAIPADKKIVLFFGTPREHKGLVEVAHALANLGRTDVGFAIIGQFHDKNLKSTLQAIQGVDFYFLGDQAYDKVPEFAALGDYCVLLQQPDSAVSQFQIPAKLSDALACGLTVLASAMPPFSPLFDKQSIVAITPNNLEQQLRQLLAQDAVRNPHSVSLFQDKFSFAANLPVLQKVWQQVNAASAANQTSNASVWDLLLKKACPSYFAALSNQGVPSAFALNVNAATAQQMSQALQVTDSNKASHLPTVSQQIGSASKEKWCYSVDEMQLLSRVRDYLAKKPFRQAKVVIYTAIMGGYDELVLPETIVDDWDYVLFYDTPVPEQKGESIFEFRPSAFHDADPARIARYLKTHPHTLFPEYDYAVWLDPNILVRGEHLKNAIADCIARDVLLMVNPHPDRQCVYDELAMCIKRAKDDTSVMEKQVARYKAEGFPAKFGMFETGITLRKVKGAAIEAFNEAWWHEIETGSRRDQLSVMYVLWKLQMPFEYLPNMKNIRDHIGNDYCLFGHASKKSASTIEYFQPSFMRLPAHKNVLDEKQISSSALLMRVNDYKRKRNHSKKVVVYTAIANNYDVLKIPEYLSPDWDYVCFTDRADMAGNHPWQIRPFDYIDADHTRTARYVKTHPHLYFPEYEYSIWIDAHLLLKSSYLAEFLQHFSAKGHLLAAIPHPFRSCTYIEGKVCCTESKDDAQIINQQLERYRQQGFPDNYGLIESGVMVRRHQHKLIQRANQEWWNEIVKGSKRDQLSLMYVLWKNQLDFKPLLKGGTSVRNHSGFAFFQHGLTETKRDARYQFPSFLPHSFALDQQPFWVAERQPFDPSSLQAFSNTAVDIVICVHNALEDVKVCVDSVLATVLPPHHVFVIDDGSREDTASYLAQMAPQHKNLTLIRHDEAHGYTRSASQGMRAGTAPFVILLNSDTIVAGNWILKMLQAAMSSPDVGVVGPMSNAASWQSMPLLRDAKTGKMAVNDLPAGKSVADMDLLCEKYGWFGHFPRVPLVNGFCYGIRREVINAIGCFDHEAFPRGYGEEDDFSMRALDAGFMHKIVTHCYVHHTKSKSFGQDTRAVLAKAGGIALRQRHSERRIAQAVELMAHQPLLARIRIDISAVCQVDNPEKIQTALGLPAHHQVLVDQGKTLESNWQSKFTLAQLCQIAPNVYSPELLLARISAEELANNSAFVREMRQREHSAPQTALWILPSYSNILAGGIRTLFMVAENFSQNWGTLNYIVLFRTTKRENIQQTQDVKRHFPDLKFSFIYFDDLDEPSNLPATDAAFCSSWPTAYVLARYNNCKSKFYFMQDYETLFYAAGSMSGLIDQSYDFGFYCLANTSGIAERYRPFSSYVDFFVPGVDSNVFTPAATPASAARKIHQVVFYARPEKARNGFAIGLKALKKVKQHFGDAVRIVAVGAAWEPATYGVENLVENLGQLGSLQEVAALYQQSDVGLVLMLTPHPSYQPLEYMACGCVTVTNRNAGTNWLFQDGENAVLRSTVPDDIAEGIILALQDKTLRDKIIAGGKKTVANMTWKNAFNKIRTYVTSPNPKGAK